MLLILPILCWSVYLYFSADFSRTSSDGAIQTTYHKPAGKWSVNVTSFCHVC